MSFCNCKRALTERDKERSRCFKSDIFNLFAYNMITSYMIWSVAIKQEFCITGNSVRLWRRGIRLILFSIHIFNLSLSLEKETRQCNDELRPGYNNREMSFRLTSEFIAFMFILENLREFIGKQFRIL